MVMAMVRNTRLKTKLKISFFRLLMRLFHRIATGRAMTRGYCQTYIRFIVMIDLLKMSERASAVAENTELIKTWFSAPLSVQ